MFVIWNFFLTRFRFTYLVVAALVIAGGFSLLTLPREASPEVVVPIGVVSTVYPGASPVDVERLVTDELEKEIEGLDDLSDYTSISREGVSTIVVNFDARADVDDRIRALRDAVNTAEPNLPDSAESPRVSEISFTDQPIIAYGLAADVPEAELKKMAEEIKDQVEAISGIASVTITGDRETEILVNTDKTKLDQFGLTISDITSAIQAANLTFPIGSIQTDDIRYSVRLDSELIDPENIENLPVKQVDGVPVYVRDVAAITFDLAEAVTRSRVSEHGEPSINAVTISVRKKAGGDITKLVEESTSRIQGLLDESYPEATLITTFNTAEEVQKSLSDLSGNGVATVIIISLLLWLFLGGREALLAGLSVPITFLIGFIGLLIFDSSINFLSLFSLILALGIVVDTGIVITEGLHEYIKKGETPIRAAAKTVKEYQWPLISGTLTTVSAFVPMLFMGGIMGQYIKHIPITVNMVLVGSLFTALAIMPLLGSRFLKAKTSTAKLSITEKYVSPRIERLHSWYEQKLRLLLNDKKAKKKFTWIFVGLFVAAMALPLSGVLEVIMFPGNDADFFYIDIKAPVGSTLDITDLTVRQIEDILYQDSRVTSFFVDIGRGNPLSEVVNSGAHLASFTINIDENRKESTEEILKEYRKKLTFINDADVSVTQVDSGPPTGAPVLIQFTGPDLNELDRLALDAAEILEKIDGAVEVKTSNEETPFEFVISIDRALAIQKGLTPFQVATAVRTAVAGTNATDIRYEGDDIDVVVTQSLNPLAQDVEGRTITTIDEIKQMLLTSPTGEQVSISAIADIELAPGRSVINHVDGQRQTSATAQVEGTSPTSVFEEFKTYLPGLGISNGYQIKLGGEAEDIQESFNDLFRALIIGIFLIASILLLQFNSYRQPLFILVTLPLALIGVFFGLTIIRQPLSFPAFIGIVALSGVVVNDAIILIDKINRNRRYGLSKYEAIIQAGRARLQPIMLTTLTTVAGILPLTLSDPIWSGLGASIIFGLMFATVLTLAVVPMLYLRWGEETIE